MEKIILIVRLLPVLIELLKAVEAAIPGQGNGEQKLSAVRVILETTLDGFDTLWPSIEKIISMFVGVFNTVGEFKK